MRRNVHWFHFFQLCLISHTSWSNCGKHFVFEFTKLNFVLSFFLKRFGWLSEMLSRQIYSNKKSLKKIKFISHFESYKIASFDIVLLLHLKNIWIKFLAYFKYIEFASNNLSKCVHSGCCCRVDRSVYGSTNEIIMYRVPLVVRSPSWKWVKRPGCMSIHPRSVATTEQL